MTKTKMNTTYRTIEIYKVMGITTETDKEIIDYCDRNAFFGRVIRYGNGIATVEIDID